MKKVVLATSITVAALMFTGCAPTMPGVAQTGTKQVEQRVGFIMTAKDVKVESDSKGFANIVGGAIGAVIGNQFGGGTGKALATGAGAAAGAVAGSLMSTVDGQELTVLLENKKTVMITKPTENNVTYNVGDYVMVTFSMDGKALGLEPAKDELVKKLVAAHTPLVRERDKVVRQTVYVPVYVPQQKANTSAKKVSQKTKTQEPKQKVVPITTKPATPSVPGTQINKKSDDGVDFMVVEK